MNHHAVAQASRIWTRIAEPTIMALVLLLGLLMRTFNLLYFHTLDTDEAIYVQTMYSVTQGLTPYRDVFFAHPPFYLFYGNLILGLAPNLWVWRFSNVILGLSTVVLLYFLGRNLYDRKLAVIASAIYAFYPLIVYTNKLGLLENLQTLLLTAMFLLFSKYNQLTSKRYLYFSGVLGGLSLMTKYSSLYVMGGLLLYMIYKRVRINGVVVFLLGVFTSTTSVLGPIILSGLWPDFYVETIGWQFIRFEMSSFEKFWSFFQFIAATFPLLLLAAPTIANPRKDGDKIMLLWFGIPMVSMVFGKVLFLQHLLIVLAPYSLLAARSLQDLPAALSKLRGTDVGKTPYIPRFTRSAMRKFLIRLILLLIIVTETSLLIRQYYGDDPLFLGLQFGSPVMTEATQAQILAASYISNITAPGDKIWTTDAGIAFLAQRTIAIPDVRYWRFQGFFQDVWGYSGSSYRGPLPSYPLGLLSLGEILATLQKYNPEVLVIVRTSSVDHYIWQGISNENHRETGLAEYIRRAYHLGPELNGIGSTFYPQNIEIWVRN